MPKTGDGAREGIENRYHLGWFLTRLRQMLSDFAEEVTEKEFARSVEICARDQIDAEILNRGPARAVSLIAQMFATASKEVFVLTGCLTAQTDDGEEIYSDKRIIDEVENFARRAGSRLVIISEHQIHGGDNNPLIRTLSDLQKGCNAQVEVYENAAKTLSEEERQHFIVVDGRAWRFETCDLNHAALANFNDPSIGERLREMFLGFIDRVRIETSGAKRLI